MFLLEGKTHWEMWIPDTSKFFFQEFPRLADSQFQCRKTAGGNIREDPDVQRTERTES